MTKLIIVKEVPYKNRGVSDFDFQTLFGIDFDLQFLGIQIMDR